MRQPQAPAHRVIRRQFRRALSRSVPTLTTEIDVGVALLPQEPQLPQPDLPPRTVCQTRKATWAALAATISATRICCQWSDMSLPLGKIENG